MLFGTLSLGVVVAVTSSSAFTAMLDDGAIATPDEYGVKVTARILKAGGNTADVAMTATLTLAATHPKVGNIGGGDPMTLYMDGKPCSLDCHEVASRAASRAMYLDGKDEMVENLSLVDAKAADVLGTVMGPWEARKRFGRLPWSGLLTPAIGYT